MRHREPYSMRKITIWIRDEDWPWLRAQGRPRGASRIIRELIVDYRRKIEEPRDLEGLDLEGLLEGL